jgi:hypothetical protein
MTLLGVTRIIAISPKEKYCETITALLANYEELFRPPQHQQDPPHVLHDIEDCHHIRNHDELEQYLQTE